MRPSQVTVLARDPAASHRPCRDVPGLVPACGAEGEPRALRALHLRDPGGDLTEIVQSVPWEET